MTVRDPLDPPTSRMKIKQGKANQSVLEPRLRCYEAGSPRLGKVPGHDSLGVGVGGALKLIFLL